MWFFFGFITGLLVSILVVLVQFILKSKIDSLIKQVSNKIETKEKGEIFLPPTEEMIKLEKNYEIV